jgi:hypothetical protein
VTGSRADALARLDVFVGEWVMEARFPGGQPTGDAGDAPMARSRFEWALDRQFLAVCHDLRRAAVVAHA